MNVAEGTKVDDQLTRNKVTLEYPGERNPIQRSPKCKKAQQRPEPERKATTEEGSERCDASGWKREEDPPTALRGWKTQAGRLSPSVSRRERSLPAPCREPSEAHVGLRVCRTAGYPPGVAVSHHVCDHLLQRQQKRTPRALAPVPPGSSVPGTK